MTASADSSGRPPWAVSVWADESHIFVELPGTDGLPYIMKFTASEGGLTKALQLMKDHRIKSWPQGSKPGRVYDASKPNGTGLTIKRPASSPATTQDQRNAVGAVLRKLGLI